MLRIVGGKWRGRRLETPEGMAVRPTSDRTRESLFNILTSGKMARADGQSLVQGARVLDAFAGTGALGLEALSRGAGAVTFVERDRARADAIRAALDALAPAAGARVVAQPVEAFLAGAPSPHDAVFLDPPYGSGLLAPALARLPPWLAPGARVYVEWGGGEAPVLPQGLTWLKEKRAGQVSYGLASAGETAP